MSFPSIVPRADRLDRDIYLVLEDFRDGAAWRETDESDVDYDTLIADLLTGQFKAPLRVLACNPIEGWARDASEDVARELERRLSLQDQEIGSGLQDFIEGQLGRKIGVQLSLL
jgi:hypothetical protein